MKTITLYSIQNFGHGKKAWFLKHINDSFVKKANEANYRSRASFKLIEILQKHQNMFQKHKKLRQISSSNEDEIQLEPSSNQDGQKNQSRELKFLDLGCAPGSWSQVLKEVQPNASIAAVDLLEMKPLQGVDFYRCDARSAKLHAHLVQKYSHFHLITSDMAPNFMGDTPTTHLQILQLNMLCLILCIKMGAGGCGLIMKTIHGEVQKSMFNFLANFFHAVYREKPDSSRAQSVQFFYVCQKLKHFQQAEKKKILEYLQDVVENPQKRLLQFRQKNKGQAIIAKIVKNL